MYKLYPTARFQKDVKRIQKRGYNMALLSEVLNILASGKQLPAKYEGHNLIGNFKGCRECHITLDWLLIYEISNDELVLYLTRTGTHSDLFS